MKKFYIFIFFAFLVSNLQAQDIEITEHPISSTQCIGSEVILKVFAESKSGQELKYQWYMDDIMLFGANSSLLMFQSLKHFQSGNYSCRVSNADNTDYVQSRVASVYAIRPTSITRQPDDVRINLSEGKVVLTFDAHVNGMPIAQALMSGENIKIQWYEVLEHIPYELIDNEIFSGSNSNLLNVHLTQLLDTTYYFASINGSCGAAVTRTVRIIKNLDDVVINLAIDDLDPCNGSIRTIKAEINNPNNYEMEFQWFKDDMPIINKHNVIGSRSDELVFSPILPEDEGRYRLEANIKKLNYNLKSNSIDMKIIKVPKLVALRIEDMTAGIGYRTKVFLSIFYEIGDSTYLDVYRDGELVNTWEPEWVHNAYDLARANANIGLIPINYGVDTSNKDARYWAVVRNRCGTSISDTVTIRDNLNDFEGRDPWNQYREFCEGESTTLQMNYYLHKQSDLNYSWASNNGNTLTDEKFYEGRITNKLTFKNLRKLDDGHYHITARTKHGKEIGDTTIWSNKFVIKVYAKPAIFKQPNDKVVSYGDLDTLMYVQFLNEEEEEINVELYYMPYLNSTPQLIQQTTALHGLWYRYIREVTFADDGYYFAKFRHDNFCGYSITDTIKIDVQPKTSTSVKSDYSTSLTVFPNPASEYITITKPSKGFEPSEGSEIKIFNTLGECVIELTDVQHLGDVGHLQRIDVSNLPRGVYYLRIGSRTQMFVKM
ncbi:MAG: T9SS type A sorting domain-containing protein [Desulfobulbaceae bacterium]|nr:T9SS type A sorting domain-containing protein [Candidatus Kapabacteria bacterium]MBS3999200.1 T9SS type A sorting domain-containing protein [Desulfobulbaceae bacterium]